MNAHGVNLPLLKVHAKLLKWQKLYLPAFSHVINFKKNNLLKFKIHALMQIRHHAMLSMNVHGVNLPLLKVHAKLLKWLRLSQQVFLLVISYRKKFLSKWKIHVLMQIKHHAMLSMNAHGVNLPLLKAHARLLKWQKLYLPVFLLVTNSKKNNQLKWKILALMLIVQHAMLQMNAHGASQLQ